MLLPRAFASDDLRRLDALITADPFITLVTTDDDGAPIAKADRVLYRERADLQQAFPNPYASGRGSFQEWLEHEGA